MTFTRGRILGVALGICVTLAPAGLPAATVSARVALPGSVLTFDTLPPTPATPHKPFITRRTLQPSETAETIHFEVALQMRNFSELQQRVAQGEHISVQEMAAKYYPAVADYQNVVDWLTEQGFTIVRQDPSRVAVFARGQVSQLQTRLAMSFGRVTQDGTEYTSALSAPSVPADIAPLLIGINGLQPNLRMYRHSILRPASTYGQGAPFEPSQLAFAYGASSLYNYDINGTNETIAIVIDTYPLMTDLTSFWSDFGVNRGNSTVTFVPTAVSGVTPDARSGEETLDTEWSSSIAPGANVRVYISCDLTFADLDTEYSQVYSDVTNSPGLDIHEMSMSYGAGESYVGSGQVVSDDQYFAELAAAGVTVFASSGDQGATPPDSNGANQYVMPETPASDPNVTGVGGTSLLVDGNGNPSSEVVWNDGYGASGGAASAYFSRPSWQTGSTVPTNPKNRLVPDVACSADPSDGGYVILSGGVDVYGGTSWSSPTWAGFCALLNQARANTGLGTLGILGPSIYPLVGTANFRDITSGNNKYESKQGYTAKTGYDLVTGVGVPDVTVLAQTLSGSTTLAPNLVSVGSVQLHAGTPYTIPLPLTGSSGVECREIDGSLQLVFTFIQPVISGTAEVAEGKGTGTVSSVSFSGDTMTVDLDDVADAQNITVVVSNINGTSATDSVAFGVLEGDVNGDGGVNSQDVLMVRSTVGTVAGQSGFNPRTDVDEDGGVNSQDVLLTQSNVSHYLH